jgi:predicted outer membrane repeat protein
MSSWNSTVTVLGSVFNGNAADYGGAMYSGESTTTLANCVMAGNTARDGGGLYAVGNGTTAVNCTLVGNTASNLGGGIYAQAVQVTNGILWGNSAGSGSPQLYLFVGSPAPAYSCIQGGSTDNGNIASDPLLNGDHTLNTASPCIDKGNSSAVPADVTTDLAGQARIVGSCVDMGAYEYQ